MDRSNWGQLNFETCHSVLLFQEKSISLVPLLVKLRLVLNLISFRKFYIFQGELHGDATIRTKYQIRTKVGFGPKTNSDLISKLGPEF